MQRKDRGRTHCCCTKKRTGTQQKIPGECFFFNEKRKLSTGKKGEKKTTHTKTDKKIGKKKSTVTLEPLTCGHRRGRGFESRQALQALLSYLCCRLPSCFVLFCVPSYVICVFDQSAPRINFLRKLNKHGSCEMIFCPKSGHLYVDPG